MEKLFLIGFFFFLVGGWYWVGMTMARIRHTRRVNKYRLYKAAEAAARRRLEEK